MFLRSLVILSVLVVVGGAGCIDVDIPIANDLFATGTSFVLSGTAALVDQDGPCLVWLGENGMTYHLFQDPRVANEDFDAVTNPGTTSRLKLAVRTDLYVDCQVGVVVEVQDVLEIVE